MLIKKLSILLECSRIYSLPTTIMSWAVVFTFGVLNSGKVLYGLLALAGISLAHLATNVLDDFCDYKSLIKHVNFDKQEYLKNTQKTKCRYLVSGLIFEYEVLSLVFIYLIFAGLIGLFFFLKCGLPVLIFAAAGGIIAISYSFLSRIKLSEFAVGLAYGPALFGGVYYVMTKTISWEVFVLSIPTMIMTIVLLYIHTVMDYDFDLNENHFTIANSFDSQLESLIVLKILLISAYIAPVFVCIFDISDWQIFGVYLTIPLAIDLYKSMEDYSVDSKLIPEHKWYHFPMENMELIEKMNATSFMVRMYQSRNLMIYFSLLLALGLIPSTL